MLDNIKTILSILFIAIFCAALISFISVCVVLGIGFFLFIAFWIFVVALLLTIVLIIRDHIIFNLKRKGNKDEIILKAELID